MARFPADATRERVVKAFERLGFRLVREGNHLAMVREKPDGARIPIDHAQSSPDQAFDVTLHSHTDRDSQRRLSEGIRGHLSFLRYTGRLHVATPPYATVCGRHYRRDTSGYLRKVQHFLWQ